MDVPVKVTRRGLVGVGAAVAAAASRPAAAAGTDESAAAWPGPHTTPADWPQHMRSSYQHGWNHVESALTPATVGGLGIRWSTLNPNASRGALCVVGNSVYVSGESVSRLDAATGAVIWTRRLGLRLPIPTPAYAHGLLVVAGKMANDRDHSQVVALEAATGRVVWRRRVPTEYWPSSPAIAGGSVVFTCDRRVVALSLRTGAVRWTWSDPQQPDSELYGHPTSDGSRVFVGAGEQVIALAAASGALLWRRAGLRGDGQQRSMPLLDGRLYVGTIREGIACLDASTGAQVWRTPLRAVLWWPITATPTRIVALATTDGGAASLVRAFSPGTGRPHWTYKLPDADYRRPSDYAATAAGVVYVGWSTPGYQAGRARLDALSLRNGKLLHRVDLPDVSAPESIAVSRGRLYLVQERGSVVGQWVRAMDTSGARLT